MTKLFSVKSLAFAGAAAFALTLAAAPQADAAETTTKKITLDMADIQKVKVIDADQKKLSKTDDGKVIYYQLLKDNKTETINKAKNDKFVAIADENLGYYNFASLMGKDKYLMISPDGTKENATGVAIKAAPKVSAKYKTALEIKIGKTVATIATEGGVDKKPVVMTATADGKKYKINGMTPEQLQSSTVLGNTIEFTVIEKDATDGIASESKTVKLKVSAKAKAPKVSLKLDAAKAFTWKISDKQEYKIKIKDKDGKVTKESEKWAKGHNDSKDDWAAIFTQAGVDKSVVSGDAITADIEISLRTKEDPGKKAASAINLIKLSKSVASPTSEAIKVTTKAETKGKATVTSASIKTTLSNLQYSDNNGSSWKKITKNKDLELKKSSKDTGNEKKFLIRYAGEAKNATVLPSLNSVLTINYETGNAKLESFGYKATGEIEVTTKTFSISK